MPGLTQLTLRGITPQLEDAIRSLSRKEGISLNKAALKLLTQGANLDRGDDESRTIGHDLDHLFGTWTESEATAFLQATESCRQVDGEFWK